MKYVFFKKKKNGEYWGKYRTKDLSWSEYMGPFNSLLQARFFVHAHFNIVHS